MLPSSLYVGIIISPLLTADFEYKGAANVTDAVAFYKPGIKFLFFSEFSSAK
jgi:hypothetical protein